MKRSGILKFLLILFAVLSFSTHPGTSQNNNSHNPTWWDKYQYIANNGSTEGGGATSSVSLAGNVEHKIETVELEVACVVKIVKEGTQTALDFVGARRLHSCFLVRNESSPLSDNRA